MSRLKACARKEGDSLPYSAKTRLSVLAPTSGSRRKGAFALSRCSRLPSIQRQAAVFSPSLAIASPWTPATRVSDDHHHTTMQDIHCEVHGHKGRNHTFERFGCLCPDKESAANAGWNILLAISEVLTSKELGTRGTPKQNSRRGAVDSNLKSETVSLLCSWVGTR